MSRTPPALAAALLPILLLAMAPRPTRADEDFVDGIAAQVGSDIVLASEVRTFARPVEEKMREAGAPESEIVKMRAEILERMIERRLIEQAIKRTEIDATEAEIDGAIESIAKENQLTLDQLRKTVEARGLTYEGYREEIRQEIQRHKLVGAAVRSQVRVEDEEVRKLYQERFADQPQGGAEVRLRHILVPFESDSPDAETAACARVEAARREVAAGADFAEVARDVSAVNPQFGGDVGWVHTRNMAAWMKDPVSRLSEGQMSPVVRTPFGCNVLLLVERREYKPLTYEEAAPQLKKELFEQKAQQEYHDFVEQLREKTYIERKGVYADAARLTPAGAAPAAQPEPAGTF